MGKTKYIGADAFLAKMRHIIKREEEQSIPYEDMDIGHIEGLKRALRVFERMPAADVVSVVRCGECKHQDKGENECEAWNLCGYRPWLHIPTEDDAFCSKGERKDG